MASAPIAYDLSPGPSKLYDGTITPEQAEKTDKYEKNKVLHKIDWILKPYERKDVGPWIP